MQKVILQNISNLQNGNWAMHDVFMKQFNIHPKTII
ncbi:hypothetical protein VII00023_10589 [Vibrio ichthyoenteri ATCC 700023]|uniref:Uncharacterized protein n=1 Tax=Vibrio ichthyoenteri ATCC 700023 TaxID=870968 RepID=F9S312_9VIBR|nr:hypothetical protein VII00023_10589 [Vibrio ichthyoenteri ATCC 700023]